MGSHSGAGAGAGGGDKLSALGDAVLGHVLSFLPANEAARAAALSRRWRHVLAHVHTVSLDEPDPPIPDYDGDWSPGYGGPVNRNAVYAPPFADGVSAALFARLHRGGTPLRALRVGFQRFTFLNAGIVDAWLAYAVRQAADELHLDLRLRREPVCSRAYSLRPGVTNAADKEGGAGQDPAMDESESYWQDEYPASPENEAAGDGASPASPPSDDDDEEPPRRCLYEYVTPRSLFSCAALRSLRIGPCRLYLPPPAAIALPSLSTLHLTAATGRSGGVQRLVSACPRLADLTLESCEGLTKLSLLGARRLRRLALRCCHGLAAVAAEALELRAFEYRGAIPGPSFLTLRGGAQGITSCALDFCGAEAAAAELANLAGFLRLFAGVERLRLTSARLGCGGACPAFPALWHLQLTGMLPDDTSSAAAATVAAVSRVLRRAPELETLTLFFLPEPEDLKDSDYNDVDEEELLDGHKLRYDRHAPLAAPEDAGITNGRRHASTVLFLFRRCSFLASSLYFPLCKRLILLRASFMHAHFCRMFVHISRHLVDFKPLKS